MDVKDWWRPAPDCPRDVMLAGAQDERRSVCCNHSCPQARELRNQLHPTHSLSREENDDTKPRKSLRKVYNLWRKIRKDERKSLPSPMPCRLPERV